MVILRREMRRETIQVLWYEGSFTEVYRIKPLKEDTPDIKELRHGFTFTQYLTPESYEFLKCCQCYS